MIPRKSFFASKAYNEAYTNYENGNEILEKIFGRYTIHSANCFVSMAQIKHKMNKPEKSFQLYEVALNIYTNLLGENHLYTYRIYLNLLFLAFQMKKEQKISALENKLVSLLEKVVSFLNSNNLKLDLNSFITYNELANLFRKNKRYERALDHYLDSM